MVSYYFEEKRPLPNYDELDRRLRNGELRFALEVPSKVLSSVLRMVEQSEKIRWLSRFGIAGAAANSQDDGYHRLQDEA